MIADDPYLRDVFNNDATMLCKLHDFVVRYGLASRPALIIQAKPTGQPLEIDVRDAQYSTLLASGAGRRPAWWQGFAQYGPGVSPTFDGIELVSDRQSPQWASNLHTDGHLLAGTWQFYDTEDDGDAKRLVLPYFFNEIFGDFTAILRKLQATLKTPVTFNITATLWQAPKLHYGQKPNFGNNFSIRPPTLLPVLQWRIRPASNQVELDQVAAMMSNDFLAALGNH